MTTLTDLQSKRAEMVDFNVGEPFPSIVLPNAEDGSEMSLTDFHGQKVLLHIFASW